MPPMYNPHRLFLAKVEYIKSHINPAVIPMTILYIPCGPNVVVKDARIEKTNHIMTALPNFLVDNMPIDKTIAVNTPFSKPPVKGIPVVAVNAVPKDQATIKDDTPKEMLANIFLAFS